MNKTIDDKSQYELMLDKYGFNNETMFLMVFSRLDFYVGRLIKVYDINNHISLNGFILRIVSKMLNVAESIFLISTHNNDISSMLTLSRSNVDSYAIINFLYNTITDADERLLRIMLYHIDAFVTRISLLSKRNRNYDSFYITNKAVNNVETNCNNATLSDTENLRYIIETIKGNPKYTSIHPQVLEKGIWRHKIMSNNSRYSWRDLYKFAFNDFDSSFNHDYLSHYVHNLGISDIQYFEDLTEIPFAISLNLHLINLTIKLLERTFPEIKSQYEKEYISEIFPVFLTFLTDNAKQEILTSSI